MNKVRRVNDFPKFETPKTGAGFIFGIFVWIFAILAFCFFFYVALFMQNLIFLLQKIKHKSYQIPFWFLILCVIFLFPLTLIIILTGTLWRILVE